jgi:hypothetical protein
MKRVWIAATALLAVALAGAALTTGQTAARDKDKDSEDADVLSPRAIDKMVLDTLRDVINRGADLYNGGEWTGCYRLYEGALRTVKPFLKHRPNLQKAIDEGLVNAQNDPVSWRRAFVLRAVLDKIRKEVRPPKEEPETKKAPEKKEAEKKEPEKPEKKKPEKKDPDDEKEPADAATVTGKVTLDGAALSLGLLTLHPTRGKAVVALIGPDGTYEVRGVAPGEARLSIATVELLPVGARPKKVAFVEVPEKYHDPDTSGLTVTLGKGPQVHDVALSDG